MKFIDNKTAPKDLNLWKAWANSFSVDELQKQGWDVARLQELFLTNDFFGLLIDEQLASVVIYHSLGKNHREVLFLGTAPVFRQKGRMRQLLRHFLAMPESNRVWLECRSDNREALELYQRMGFKVTGERSNYYSDGTNAILLSFSANGTDE